MLLITDKKITVQIEETPAGGRKMFAYSPITRKVLTRYTHPSRAKSLRRFIYDIKALETALGSSDVNGVSHSSA